MKKILIGTLAFVILTACSQIQKATDVITNPTAREVYARNFSEENVQYQQWKTAFEAGKRDSLAISLPYLESGQYQYPNRNAHSYNIDLQEGEQLQVKVMKDVDSVHVFIDLFKLSEGQLQQKPLAQAEENETQLTFEAKETAAYKLIIQPEMEANTPFQVSVFTQPTFGFPVAGKGNKDIQSYWGATRDGGRRSHEGVDIFAPRGTPVVAATDGRVSSTGNRGLGGNQVWLREGLFGGSLYYAHLDSIIAIRGQRVKKGDTLGLVGNSGNARTTAPHLHFGIYKGYSGAINPLPFIEQKDIPNLGEPFSSKVAAVTRNKAELRLGPSTSFTQIASLQQKDTVEILGKTGNWFHIQPSDSLKGFMHRSLLKVSP
ncbi:M23 family metallopeptidase [Luteirhabdus pelagi]|uniref:M23 family metallopeptidase n=1 Tax=Luteirhabdus pelagi TaxID=2792783 RepID=UPI001939E5F3|nr:M23 family metallopeptidase [Luteirhabdus pelagi]